MSSLRAKRALETSSISSESNKRKRTTKKSVATKQFEQASSPEGDNDRAISVPKSKNKQKPQTAKPVERPPWPEYFHSVGVCYNINQ
jgi:hypothetical protein